MIEWAAIKTILSVFTAPLMILVGYFGWALRRVQVRLEDTPTEKEVRHIVNDKLEIIRVEHLGVTKRLDRLEGKLDRLIDLHLRRFNKHD